MTNEQPPTPPDAVEPEVVDGLPVLDGRPEEAEPEADTAVPASLRGVADLVLATPARQVATLAASGFVAGAATVALVHRHHSRSAVKRLRARRGGRPALGEIVHSNSFLVDVHLLRRD